MHKHRYMERVDSHTQLLHAVITWMGGSALLVSQLTRVVFSALEIPNKNEKYLASISAGKWVLHKSYLAACHKQGHFVKVSVTNRATLSR